MTFFVIPKELILTPREFLETPAKDFEISCNWLASEVRTSILEGGAFTFESTMNVETGAVTTTLSVKPALIGGASIDLNTGGAQVEMGLEIPVLAGGPPAVLANRPIAGLGVNLYAKPNGKFGINFQTGLVSNNLECATRAPERALAPSLPQSRPPGLRAE